MEICAIDFQNLIGIKKLIQNFCTLCNKSLTTTVLFEHNKRNNYLLKTGQTSKVKFVS